jgi:hypothetical protein
MRCEEIQSRLTDYLANQMEDSARAEIREHLPACPACRAEYKELEAVWTTLGRLPAEPIDSAGMRSRFSEALESHRGASRRGWLDWWPAQPVLQLGIAVALLLSGVFVGFHWTPAPLSRDAAELRVELHDARQMLALSLLQQPSASERLRGVDWSTRIDDPGNEVVSALLDTLTHDPNVNVRLATVDALRRFSEQEAVRAATTEALSDLSSPLLQIALIDFMVETRHTDAVAQLSTLSKDPEANEAVRGRAAWSLRQLGS